MSSAAGLSGLPRRAARAWEAERIAFWRAQPVRPSHVLYESFAGNGMLCNPEAIFRHLLDRDDFAHLHHVWALADDESMRRFQAEFRSHSRVRMVRRGSTAYFRALSTCGYLVNNATFPPAFGKRAGQVYLNTWHGTPLKRMGFDMPDGAVESANTLRNFLSADYLLAANSFMAQTMYEDAYRLRNIYRGRIIEEGYPRIDRQAVTRRESIEVRYELQESGVELGGERIILFAPTWRGGSFSRPEQATDELQTMTEELQAELGTDYRVLLKTHQAVHSAARRTPSLRRLLVPNTIPTNVVLGVSSGLVTDYSSIFFDFLTTGRPIAFLTPDADDYESTRGTYLPVAELPGPVSSDARATGMRLRALLEEPDRPHPGYRDWAERFVPRDDGRATERVVDIVFRGRTDGRRVRRAVSDGRTRVLLYLGGMRSNGITTSAVNLLDAVGPDRYDITVVMQWPTSSEARENQRRLPAHVRQVFRIQGMNGSKALHLRRRRDDWRGRPLLPRQERWHEQLWRDEWTRVFGDARFDWVADFSGYSPLWANLLLHAPEAVRAIWLHNEMASDRHRAIAGKQRMRRSLGLVFSLYGAFDQLISVSPRLTAINRAALALYAPADRFTTVRNAPGPAAADVAIDPSSSDEPPSWLEAFSSRRGEHWFVTVGRLSPEKNQARLIRAFAEVHREHPEARLLIIGGGPLVSELEAQIRRARLDGAAFLAGPQRDPLRHLVDADCFVLSSDYEGQPMVLLEAAMCGLPIVSTAFASVRDALPPGSIHVVDRDDQALAEGMRAYLRGLVKPSRLDVAAYTAEVLSEFQQAVMSSQRESHRAPEAAAPDSARYRMES